MKCSIFFFFFEKWTIATRRPSIFRRQLLSFTWIIYRRILCTESVRFVNCYSAVFKIHRPYLENKSLQIKGRDLGVVYTTHPKGETQRAGRGRGSFGWVASGESFPEDRPVPRRAAVPVGRIRERLRSGSIWRLVGVPTPESICKASRRDATPAVPTTTTVHSRKNDAWAFSRCQISYDKIRIYRETFWDFPPYFSENGSRNRERIFTCEYILLKVNNAQNTMHNSKTRWGNSETEMSAVKKCNFSATLNRPGLAPNWMM